MTRPIPKELEARTALVTGGGRGIGRGIALELARLGAHVVVVGRKRERLEETRELVLAAGGTADVIAADIASDEGLRALESVTARTDILVNNAAAFAPYGRLEEIDVDDARRVLDTIVLAPLRLSGAVLPAMKERRFGRVINIGSIAGALGAERQVVYASAKSALEGLTRSIALEGARHGVTCNLLELGLIATERIAEAVPPEIQRGLIANTPVGRAGSVEEVAFAVGFLASPRASFVTGTCLEVSGGLGLGLFARRPETR